MANIIKKLAFVILFSMINQPCALASSGIETLGNIGQIALPTFAALATLPHRDKTGAIEFAKAFSATLLTTYALKFSVNRRRPNGGHYSFPSGHTASSFAGAAFLQRRYGWYYGVPAYAAASYVGWSRIYANAHWPTDVLAGAAIAIGYNRLFTHRYHNNIVITPCVDQDTVGLRAEIILN